MSTMPKIRLKQDAYITPVERGGGNKPNGSKKC